MALLSLKSLTKTFRVGSTVIDDFSLDVADGELVVFFGPSGCGKTTTLRMIAGLEPATSGSIFIGDRCVESADNPRVNISSAERDVAMVFQNQALYPHLNVFGNMAFGLKMRGTEKYEIQQRVSEVAEMLGLMPFIERRPHELSGGQRQRAAIGRALVRRASVYLMDEPLASLDGPLRDHLLREIRHIHDRLGMTMLWVTHQADEAMALADRIVVLRPPVTRNGSPGGIQQIDTPETICKSPANRFVAAMIGRPGINIMTGKLEANGNQVDWHSDALTLFAIDTILSELEKHPGRELAVGIRPEDVAIVMSQQDVPSNHPVIEGEIEDVQRFGAECLVYVGGVCGTIFETGFDALENGPDSASRFGSSKSFVVRLSVGSEMAFSAGDKVTLAIDPQQLLFGLESGRLIA